MTALYIILAVSCLSVQTTANKLYSMKNKQNNLLYTALLAFSAMLVFLISVKSFTFPPRVLAFSVWFGVNYGLATFSIVMAIRAGSLARTSLVSAFSILVPAVVGILFLNEPLSPTLIAGAICFVLSLTLVISQKKQDNEKAVPITLKWIIFAVILFISNGFCSVVVKLEPLYCDGDAYSSIFMVVALAFVTVGFTVASLIKEGPKSFVPNLRADWKYAPVVGLANGVTNFLVILLNQSMNASVLYPLLSASNLLLDFLIACIFFKERFAPRQLVGFACGIAAVILFNL